MPDRLCILIVEDDPVLGPALLQRLRLEGHDPRLVSDGAQALAFARARRPDAVFSDIRLPDMNGEAIWLQLVEAIGPVPTWFMTAFGEIEQAVRLVKAGARDYLTKPVDVDALVRALDGLSDASPALAARNTPARPHPGSSAPLADARALGRSAPMVLLAGQIAKAARSDLPVLLAGETGSGKEVAARALHQQSTRANAPFVAINCATIPRDLAESQLFGHEKGAFTGATARQIGAAEEAGDGILFLDEIAELPIELQPKLLRLIEARSFRPLGASRDRAFGARIVCATHADLAGRVAARAFREDLYFRLDVIALTVPPLRERVDDIVPLAVGFLPDPAMRLTPEAEAALLRHAWPGNVRELRNRIERAAAMADRPALTVTDLFPERRLAADDPTDDSLDAIAQEAIRSRVRQAIDEAGGNQAEAARRLGVSRTTVWKYSR